MGITTRRSKLTAPTAGSYGRLGRVNATRRKKRKRLLQLSEQDHDYSSPMSKPRITRARMEEMQSILKATPSPERFVVATPPSLSSGAAGVQTRTGKRNPTCLTYGKFRRLLYGKDYFLCNACDLWEKEHKITANAKRDSKVYRCQAQHTSLIKPTQVKPAISKRLQKIPFQSDHQFPEHTDIASIPTPRRLGFSTPRTDDRDCREAQCNLASSNAKRQLDIDDPTLTREEMILEIRNLRKAIKAASATEGDLKTKLLKSANQIKNLKQRGQPKLDGDRTTAWKQDTINVGELPDSTPCSPAVISGRKKKESENGRFHEVVTSFLLAHLSDIFIPPVR